MKRLVKIILKGLILLIFTAGIKVLYAGEEGNLSIKYYKIPNHGELGLAVPKEWKSSVRQPPDELPPTITFSPATGNAFELLITALWSPRKDLEFNNPREIKNFSESEAQNLASSSVEGTFTLKEIKGEKAVGYCYSFTDKNPKPGEYKNMTQGAIGVGDLLLTFTFLVNSKDSAEEKAALDMLKKAKQRK